MPPKTDPMTAPCPGDGVLRGLLDSSLPEPVQAEIVRHLDGCRTCQGRLEAFANDGTVLLEAARHDPEPPAKTSAFWPALDRVEEHVASLAGVRSPLLDGIDLSFLAPPERPTDLGRLDRFRVEDLVGRGGMGLVFRAMDVELDRPVAVKVLDPALGKSAVARERFLREARAAARVAHANVVPIHRVEESESGLPYFVMQFVRGRSVQDMLDTGSPIPVREAVRIAGDVAAGLSAAHRSGLVHRDVKPGNVLIEEPAGRVLLTDFGLARLPEDVKLTQTGFLAGTPQYMSPEQARGEATDERTDLFSLGSVLYAMLTGTPPFAGTTPFAVMRGVTDHRPPSPHRLIDAIPASLSSVAERLLEKKPADRFPSAETAAAALAEELANLPTERPSRASRRSPLPLVAATALLIGAVGIGEMILQRFDPAVSDTSGATSIAVAEPRFHLGAGDGPVVGVAFDPCGELIATATEDGSVKFWDFGDGRIRGTLDMPAPAASIAFNHDGTRLATAGDDGVRLWDVRTKKPVGIVFKHRSAVRCLAFSADGQRLAGGTRGGGLVIWDADTGRTRQSTSGHHGEVAAVAFSPDGLLVATAGGDRTVRLWDAEHGGPHATLEGHTGPVYALAFDPATGRLASAGWDGTVRLWDTTTAAPVSAMETHQGEIGSLAYAPGGLRVLVGGQDGSAKWIDTSGTDPTRTFAGHAAPVAAVAVSKDGLLLASGGRDGGVRVWDAPVLSR